MLSVILPEVVHMSTRNQPGIINPANAFTAFRIIAVLMVVPLYDHHSRLLAIVVLACAALTDFIDGIMARCLHCQTQLGAYMDVIADKLLMIVALWLTWHNSASGTLLAILFTYELGVAAFTTGVKLHHGYTTIVTWAGKKAIVLRMSAVIGILLATTDDYQGLKAVAAIMGWCGFGLGVVAFAQYVVQFFNLTTADARAWELYPFNHTDRLASFLNDPLGLKRRFLSK